MIAGSYAFNLLSDQTALLGLILGIAFLLPAVRMIIEGVAHRKKSQPEGNVIPGSEGRKGLLGLLVGVLKGLVGLGGGYALVPGLIYLFNALVYVTMGTSLATMIPWPSSVEVSSSQRDALQSALHCSWPQERSWAHRSALPSSRNSTPQR